MKPFSNGSPLDELARKCIDLALIDRIEKNKDVVTIVRHGIIHFQLDARQAERFLRHLVEQRRTSRYSGSDEETST